MCPPATAALWRRAHTTGQIGTDYRFGAFVWRSDESDADFRPDGVPDALADPVIVAVHAALFADPTFGGLAATSKRTAHTEHALRGQAWSETALRAAQAALAGDFQPLSDQRASRDYRLQADWLVACDGARSTVRRLQGLRFEGQSYESRFVIADFNIDLDEPYGRRCYFDPPWLPGHTALMHRAPGGVWRLDYQVPAEVSDEEALEPARIRSHIDAHLRYIGVNKLWSFEWTTLYKPNALTLDSYRHGRVLYAGDAAHLLPVFGVRGMNTGVQDAINLGWKLAAVARGEAPPGLLDSYSSERVADARQICREAGMSTRMVAPPSRGHRVMQQAVLSLSDASFYPAPVMIQLSGFDQVQASVLTSFALGRLQRFARSGFRRNPTEHLDASLALMLH